MSPVTRSGISGFLATAPMTAVLIGLRATLPRRQRYPLGPRLITDHLLERAGLMDDLSRRQRTALTMVNHFAYGTAVGSLYGLLPRHARAQHPAATGAGYGLAVWTASYVLMLPALGLISPETRNPPRRVAARLVAHLVWGITLGLLTRAGDSGASQRKG